MKIGVVKEIHAGEKRVASTPDSVARLITLGFQVVVEAGAGLGSNISDSVY
jgi:NAD(P) transhydrogenase subunit alpha